MQRSGWMVGIAVVGLAGLWLLARAATGGEGEAEPVLAGVPERGPERSAAAGAGEPLSPAAEPAPTEPRASEADAPDSAPSARVGVEPSAEPGDRYDLVVLREEDGAPLPGAEVTYLVAGDSALTAFRDLLGVDRLMSRRGTTVTAGADGRVRVPGDPSRPTLVTGRLGSLWGQVELELDGEPPHELRLAPDATLRVQVVDRAGRPVPGVPVALRQDWFGSKHEVYSLEASAPDARADFPHAGRLLRAAPDGRPWSVAPDAALADPPAVPLDPDDLPTEVVALVLPPTGSVEVEVLGPGGARYAEEARVALVLIRDGEERERSPFAAGGRDAVEATAADGVARFEHVEVGHELSVRVSRAGTRVATRALARSPDRPGGEVRVAVTLGTDHPVVLLRAVDADGAPLAATRVDYSVQRVTRYPGADLDGYVATDADGRLRVDLDRAWEEGMQRTLMLSAEGGARAARIDLSRELPDGETDLGDVVLAEPPVFVGGRVVDASGRGGAEARLHLRRHLTGGRNARWDDVWEFEHRSGPDGRFEVREATVGDSFRLHAEAGARFSRVVPFRAGDDALVLALEETGSLAGSVLVDPGVDPGLLQVEVQAADRERADRVLDYDETSRVPDAEGVFGFPALLAGPYDVRVRIHRSDELWKAEGVLVTGGVETRDPRLQGIDLRGELFPLPLTIVPPDPTESVRGTLMVVPTGETEPVQRSHFYESELTLLTRHPRVDLTLTCPGYRVLRRVDVAGPQTLELRRGPRVRLVLRGGARLPEPPLYVKAALGGEDPSSGVDFGAAAFDER